MDLTALGIPAEAEVLNAEFVTLVNDLDQPFPIPAIMAGQVLRFDPFPRKFAFYGADFGKKTDPCNVQLTVTWLAHGQDEIPLHHLAEAGRQFAAGRYEGVPVSANIAVESALGPALLAWVRVSCPRKPAENFLSDPGGASYSHQLKVLTRLASSALGIPDMPDPIRGILDKLRVYRNEIVHRGHLDDKHPLSKKAAAEFLTAAVFGHQYAGFLRGEVEKRNASQA